MIMKRVLTSININEISTTKTPENNISTLLTSKGQYLKINLLEHRFDDPVMGL